MTAATNVPVFHHLLHPDKKEKTRQIVVIQELRRVNTRHVQLDPKQT